MESVRDYPETAVQSCHGPGKGLALSTPIPTPTGWTTMEAIRPGDQVFDEAGQICNVTAITPIWNLPCYRVLFSDGSEIICDESHLWSTLPLTVRHRERAGGSASGDWRQSWDLAVVQDAPTLAASLVSNSGQREQAIPTAMPLTLPEVELPIPPYVLGAWLGDGTSIRAELTCFDQGILDAIEADGWTYRQLGNVGKYWIGPRSGKSLPLFRGLGVNGNKHVPDLYKRSSRSQRLAVLQGLMDTDGYASNKDQCVEFTNTNERLANDVAELVRSLGWSASVRKGVAKLDGVEIGPKFRIVWRPSEPVFRLTRKRDRWVPIGSQFSRQTLRTIVSMDEVASVPTRCIEVDSPRNLYLAGESMIPTHNSFIAARIAAWWIDSHPPGTAKVLTSAPTFHQVKTILWGELNRTHRQGKLSGRMNMTEWYLNDEMVAFGRKPRDSAKGSDDETIQDFQGTHADFLLVIFDEACGIPKPLWLAATSLLTNDDGRILAIGNPDNSQSHFAEICAPGSGWNVIKIPLSSTPRFTDEVCDPSVLARMPTQGWLDRFIRQFGMGTNAYKSKVDAEFPESALDGVIPWSFAVKAKQTEPDLDGPVHLGIDVAGSERGDETVIRERRGNMPGRRWAIRTEHSEEIVDLALTAIEESGATVVKVDVIGVGFGVAGHLRRELHKQHVHCQVAPVNVAERSTNPKRFKNKRAQLWWEVGREGVNDGLISLRDIDDDTLSQLVNPKYSKNTMGQIVVEPKEDTIARIGHSPDDADALLLAFCNFGHGVGKTVGRQIAAARIG